MKKIAIGCFLLLTACTGAKAPAELLEKQLTADEAVQKYGAEFGLADVVGIAKERNLDLQTAKLKQEIARIDKQLAIGNLLPKIDFLAGYERSSNSLHAGLPKGFLGLPAEVQVQLLDEDFYAYSLNAQLPVFVPSLWFLAIAKQKGEDIQILLTSLSEKLIVLKTMSEYFYIQALEKEEQVLKNESLASREFLKQAEISLKTESILPWELEQAKAYAMIKDLAVRQNSREQEIARLRLLQSLNFPFDMKFSLLPEEKELADLPSLEDCILQALEHNEKWKISDLSNQVQADVKNMAISNFLPKIVLDGTFFSFDNTVITESHVSFLSVMGLFSIFNGFKNINEYRKALRQQEISELELVREYWTLLAEVRNAYNNVLSAKELFAAAKTNLSAAQGKYRQKQAERKYEIIDLKEYYEALKEYHAAVGFYEKSYYQYRLAQGTLAVAMGKNPYEAK